MGSAPARIDRLTEAVDAVHDDHAAHRREQLEGVVGPGQLEVRDPAAGVAGHPHERPRARHRCSPLSPLPGESPNKSPGSAFGEHSPESESESESEPEPESEPESEPDDEGARALLGKLNKVAAPPDLASRVPALIQRRSAGRFFAKRRRADRLPLEWLSLVMLALLALIYAVLRMAPALLPN